LWREVTKLLERVERGRSKREYISMSMIVVGL
jgi:hypothetical protein